MILSYKDKPTEQFAHGVRIKKFKSFERQAWKKLEVLEAATSLADLQALPGNRFEKLKGDRKDQYSIRINNQWRLCFEWFEKDAENVEIVDYH